MPGRERRDDLRPGGVLLRRRSRRLCSPHHVGLGDQRGHRAKRQPRVPDGEHVSRVRRPPGPVRQDEQERALPCWRLDRHAGGPGGRLDLHDVPR